MSLEQRVEAKGNLQISTSLAHSGSALADKTASFVNQVLPISLNLPEDVTFGEDAEALEPIATPLVFEIAGWIEAIGVSEAKRPDLWSDGNLEIETIIFSNLSQQGVSVLRLKGSHLALKNQVSSD